MLCDQELGEGAFGKVYKGELTGFLGGMSALVAIKTLKPGEGTFIKVYRGELTGFLGGMSALVAIKTLKPGERTFVAIDHPVTSLVFWVQALV